MQQAGAERTGRGQPQPVAAVAEVVTQGADEPQGAGCRIAQAEHLGRTVIAPLLHRDQVPESAYPGHDFIGADEGIGIPPCGFADGHEFNEPDLQGEPLRHPGKIEDLIVVDVPHGHHIEFHRRKTERQHGFNPPPHLSKAIHPGDRLHSLRAQGIEADVDLGHSGGEQLGPKLLQEHAIGGDADIVQPFDLGERPDKLHDIAPHQRLAAGEPDLGDSHGHSHPHHLQQFFIGQQIVVAELGQASCRFLLSDTVHATQVTAIGQAEAQVGNSPGK